MISKVGDIKNKLHKKVMILITARNVEGIITKTLDRISDETVEAVEEILISDNSSRDKTSVIAEEYKRKRKLKKLTIVRHDKDKGYGGSQKWGYNYAIKKGYDLVVMVHGDAQYPPEYIFPLITPIAEGKADFMFGSRMTGNPLKGNMPLYKFFGNIFLTTVENCILRTKLSEFHSGFRAYSMKALKDIPLELTDDDFHFDSQIIVQLVIAKKKIGEITIPTFYGDEKSNVRVVSYGLHVLREMLHYMLTKFGIRVYKKYDKNYFPIYRKKH